MSQSNTLLENILAFAEKDENIRGLIIVGSRASDIPVDDLADFDINFFTTDVNKYTTDDSWLSQLGTIWVYSPDKYFVNNELIPTRLVIYEGGLKVDYSLWDIKIIHTLKHSKYFDTGYKVLLDKDELLRQIPPPSQKPAIPLKPTQEEFRFAITEYWFEAYHVAKYLKREELLLAKQRDTSIKHYLLKMMEWYTLTEHEWNIDTKWNGKHIKEWLEPAFYQQLFATYGHFDTQDSWKALRATNTLFDDISRRTAELLRYTYPQEVANNLIKFTEELLTP